MASSYVNDLRLNEMATGDASGTWGTTTNTNLELIGEALGYGTEGITTNADTHTTTVADGATDPGRAMYIEYTGTLDSACTITIAPNTLNRMHFIENGTSGSQNIIISQGSGANITIPPGDVKAVYLDGAGSGAAVVDAFASLNVVDLKVQDDLTVTDDTTIGGTLGVTGVLTATSLDISGDIDVDGTSNLDIVDIDGAVNIAAATTIATDNKIQFRDTAIHISSSADGQLDLVADTEIQIAATTIDINGAINASGEIIAASLDISGNVDVDGTLETDALSIASTTVTSTAAELNFSDGVTSNIQTQLDTKATTGKAIAMALVFG
jgi:cytoskeletal protein CcmA (bactofilin family)